MWWYSRTAVGWCKMYKTQLNKNILNVASQIKTENWFLFNSLEGRNMHACWYLLPNALCQVSGSAGGQKRLDIGNVDEFRKQLAAQSLSSEIVRYFRIWHSLLAAALHEPCWHEGFAWICLNLWNDCGAETCRNDQKCTHKPSAPLVEEHALCVQLNMPGLCKETSCDCG